MKKQIKASTVTLPANTVKQLQELSAVRKKNKNLAWSQQNITIELVNNAHKKECK